MSRMKSIESACIAEKKYFCFNSLHYMHQSTGNEFARDMLKVNLHI